MKLKVLGRRSSALSNKERKSLSVPSKKKRKLNKNVSKKLNELGKRKKGLKRRI